MSMQAQEQPAAEIVRNKMIAVSTIKKISENIKNADPVNLNAFIVILISGIGELLDLSLGWQWYIVVFAVITIFALDKLNILKGKKEEVIIRRNEPNSSNK